jgi:hypothetical protein
VCTLALFDAGLHVQAREWNVRVNVPAAGLLRPSKSAGFRVGFELHLAGGVERVQLFLRSICTVAVSAIPVTAFPSTARHRLGSLGANPRPALSLKA